MKTDDPPLLLKFLTDEDFNNRIILGLMRRLPSIDLVRVQDTAAFRQDDSLVLALAAEQERILLSHDENTMIKVANERVRDARPMPGLIIIHQSTPIGFVIDELEILAWGEPEEFNLQVAYI